MRLLMILLIFLLPILGFAQDSVDPTGGILTGLAPLLGALLGKYSWAIAIFSWIGVLRFTLKPIVAIARSIAAETKTTRDDEFLNGLEQSKVWKIVLFCLDWLASLKVKPVASTEKL